MPNLFPILIDVEELAVGRVLRKLNGLEGVARIHLRLQEERNRLNGNQEIEGEVAEQQPTPSLLRDGRSIRWRGKPADSIPYRAIAEVLRHTPAHLKILGQGLVRVRISATRITGYVHRMQVRKLVTRTAPGTYKITQLGLKTFFGDKKNVRVLPPSLLKVTNNHSGFRHFILTTLKAELDNDPDCVGLISSQDMKRLIADHGMSDKNLGNTGLKMRKEGLIEFNNGHYSITENGVEVLADTPLLTNKVINQTDQEDLVVNG